MRYMQKKIFCLTISAPAGDYEMLTFLLTLNLSYGWQEEQCGDKCRFIVHCEDMAFLGELARKIGEKFQKAVFAYEELENRDWLSSWKEFFTPVPCGENYVILPPWLKAGEYGRKHKIIIDPKSAFGTGHHASTVLCLRALDSLLNSGRLRPGQSFLDLGCGTGVLGIGAALAGLGGVCADIDPLALENARDNAKINGVEQSLKILEGSVELLSGQSFDLIMANILARPLMDMAPEISKILAFHGCLVLSGILLPQADEVAKAYKAASLPEPRRIAEGEWCALVWD